MSIADLSDTLDEVLTQGGTLDDCAHGLTAFLESGGFEESLRYLMLDCCKIGRLPVATRGPGSLLMWRGVTHEVYFDVFTEKKSGGVIQPPPGDTVIGVLTGMSLDVEHCEIPSPVTMPLPPPKTAIITAAHPLTLKAGEDIVSLQPSQVMPTGWIRVSFKARLNEVPQYQSQTRLFIGMATGTTNTARKLRLLRIVKEFRLQSSESWAGEMLQDPATNVRNLAASALNALASRGDDVAASRNEAS